MTDETIEITARVSRETAQGLSDQARARKIDFDKHVYEVLTRTANPQELGDDASEMCNN